MAVCVKATESLPRLGYFCARRTPPTRDDVGHAETLEGDGCSVGAGEGVRSTRYSAGGGGTARAKSHLKYAAQSVLGNAVEFEEYLLENSRRRQLRGGAPEVIAPLTRDVTRRIA